jgi:hypothetical protein
MTWEDFGRLSKEERNHFYRCPGCGKLVDNRQIEDVKVHHDHVLHTRPSAPLRQQQPSAAPPHTEAA